MIIFYALFLLLSLYYIKCTLKWKKYKNAFPSRNVSNFSPWGNILEFWTFAKKEGVSPFVYFQQGILGYANLFRRENFFYVRVGYVPLIVVTKAKAVEELISSSKNLKKAWAYSWSHPWLGTGLLTSHGTKWKSRRELLTPSFHFDILKDFLLVFNEQSKILVETLQEETKRPWTNIIEPLSLCALDIICETVLGVSVGAQKNSESEYVKAVSRANEAITKRFLYPPYHISWCFSLSKLGSQFKKDVKLLHDFSREVIANKKKKFLANTEEIKEARRKKRKAMMDLLIEEHMKNGSLTEEDIREEVDTFAVAGHDTVTVAMNWSLYLVGLYKDVQDKLHEEIDRVFGDDYERFITTDDLNHLEYLERVIKEALRLYPSAPCFGRELSEDTVVCGVKLPKYITVSIVPYALHRDEDVFPNPEKFDPDRFLPENNAKRSPFAYIPFAAGPRNCIGQRFALMEMKVVISCILRNYTLESLDPRDKVLPAFEIVLKPSAPIRMKLRSRRPSHDCPDVLQIEV